MPLNLMLLRHAKSDWGEPGLDDHDRPLSPRGIAAAQAMGREIARRGLTPDRVLCSSALRAQQTWAEVSAAFAPKPPMETLEALYDFGDGDTLLDIIRAQGGATPSLMLVCHNPAIEGLALTLSATGDATARRRIQEKFPTGALAMIAFESSTWAEAGQTPGELVAFLRPRDIGGPAGD